MASQSQPAELPVELVESVLRCVPWHHLRGLRVVCKAWNSMIMRFPGFVPIPRPESCVLTAIRKHMPASPARPTSRVIPTPLTKEIGPWQLLDAGKARWRPITDGFIREGLVRDVRGISFLIRRTIATSGGLIYAMYEADDRRRSLRHVVCNPVCRSFHQIPVPPGVDNNIAVMVVDAASQHYNIFQIRGTTRGRSRPGEVYLYDSWVRLWTTRCIAPAGPTRCPTSYVILGGILYALFLDEQNRRHELFSCDLETDFQWRLVEVSLPALPVQPQVIKSNSQVVVAVGHLFMVEYSGHAYWHEAWVAVWRIALGRRPSVTLVVDQLQFLNHGGFRIQPMTFPMVAVGCRGWIVVSSFNGQRKILDAVRGFWYQMLPFMPLFALDAAWYTVFVGPISHLNMRTMPPQ